MAPWAVRVEGGFGSYRCFVNITMLLLRDILVTILHCGTPILLILLEPHSTNKAYGYKTLLNTWCFYAHTTKIGNRISINIVYIHIHTYTHYVIYKHIYAQTYKHYTYIHTNIYIQKHIHTYTDVYTCTHTHTHLHTHTLSTSSASVPLPGPNSTT